jgi:hypothetical protein
MKCRLDVGGIQRRSLDEGQVVLRPKFQNAFSLSKTLLRNKLVHIPTTFVYKLSYLYGIRKVKLGKN